MMHMLGFSRKERGESASPHTPNPNPNLPPSASPSISSSIVENNSDVLGLGDQAKPLLLVYCDDKGRFQMSPEAVRALQLVKGPVGVVSVCGRSRQGKSFILNQLLGKSAGFQVASTHRPCTKGLWIWSAPIKRTAIDGSEYNLLLLDSEGIDAYDQTGTYSTQIFSLAILLSSMFIYNQMGGIDEAALDRLSLVTELTKHIRVRASNKNPSWSEIGKFSPVFVWLLRDFYLDLTENNQKITPRDYLELALRPMAGVGKDISAKNEIRESIRALFPDRECFTLVRPLNKESDLQRLDKMPFDSLRPEFRSGLDALTKFVFQRTKPKQVGSTIMNGPVFAGLTQSFLDAINNGAVPTISSSWQSVEEAECRKAYDSAADVYMSTFDRTRPHEELELRDAHENAVQNSLDAYNSCAVGAGVARLNYEKLLQKFCRKAFEDYKRNAFLEADLQCSNVTHNMETRLQAACHVPGAKFENLIQEFASMLPEYESSTHGPRKWKKFIAFLQKCLEGPILDLSKKQLERIESEKSALQLECRKSEENMLLLKREKEASEKQRDDYWKQYQATIRDKERLSKDYMDGTASMHGKIRMMEERVSRVSKDLSLAKEETDNWKAKYELSCSEHKEEEGKFGAQVVTLKSRLETVESKLAAARVQAESALEEKSEWKRKYDVVVRETKNALERAAVAQENTDRRAKEREDELRAQFSRLLEKQDEEIKNLLSRMEQSETRAERFNKELEASRLKLLEHESRSASFKHEIKALNEMLASAKSENESQERELVLLRQERDNIQDNFISECAKYNAADRRLKDSEKEAKKSSELAEVAHAEAARALREKDEAQHLAEERLATIERTAAEVETLEREKSRLLVEVEKLRMAENDALFKISELEQRVDEREKEIELMLAENNEQRSDTVQVLEGLLATERSARAEAEARAEMLSLQLQAIQGKLDSVQQELTLSRLNESALDGKRKSTRAKRSQAEVHVGTESVHDMDVDQQGLKDKKRSKIAISNNATSLRNQIEDGNSGFTTMNEDSNPTQEGKETDHEDHTKFTIAKLKQELTKHGFGAEMLQLKNPNKKDLLALYEKLVLMKK